MSNLHRAMDQIHFLSDLIASEPDPIRRLTTAHEIYDQIRKQLRRSVYAAAYEARMHYASSDISSVTGLTAEKVNYYAKQHAQREGLPVPKRRKRVEEFIDLSGE